MDRTVNSTFSGDTQTLQDQRVRIRDLDKPRSAVGQFEIVGKSRQRVYLSQLTEIEAGQFFQKGDRHLEGLVFAEGKPLDGFRLVVLLQVLLNGLPLA